MKNLTFVLTSFRHLTNRTRRLGYRYAWAQRALKCGHPERFAQQALGHNSKAVHHTYSKNADIIVPSLEDWETHWTKSQRLPGEDLVAPQLALRQTTRGRFHQILPSNCFFPHSDNRRRQTSPAQIKDDFHDTFGNPFPLK